MLCIQGEERDMLAYMQKDEIATENSPELEHEYVAVGGCWQSFCEERAIVLPYVAVLRLWNLLRSLTGVWQPETTARHGMLVFN